MTSPETANEVFKPVLVKLFQVWIKNFFKDALSDGFVNKITIEYMLFNIINDVALYYQYDMMIGDTGNFKQLTKNFKNNE